MKKILGKLEGDDATAFHYQVMLKHGYKLVLRDLAALRVDEEYQLKISWDNIARKFGIDLKEKALNYDVETREFYVEEVDEPEAKKEEMG